MQYVLVFVLVCIVVLAVVIRIGKRNRNVPVVVDEPEFDPSPIYAQVFEQFYYMVLVRHLNGEEYIEVRDKRSHKVIGTVADDLIFIPIVHINQKGQ